MMGLKSQIKFTNKIFTSSSLRFTFLFSINQFVDFFRLINIAKMKLRSGFFKVKCNMGWARAIREESNAEIEVESSSPDESAPELMIESHYTSVPPGKCIVCDLNCEKK